MAIIENEVRGLLGLARNVIMGYKGTVGDGNTLADISKIARVEPITLISSSLSGQKELYNILHGVLNVYAAYYLQAIHILSAELVDVRILKILDKTNPDRDLKTALTSGYLAYESALPSQSVRTLSLEGAKYKLPSIANMAKGDFAMEEQADLAASIDRLDTFDKLGSAVGKVVQVSFNVGGNNCKDRQEVKIPVVVKLDNMIIPGEVINSLMVSNKDSIKLGSRFKDAISGRIDFIKDFLLCSDLINSQKKTMKRDPTGAYSALLKRINNSKIYSALTGNVSLAGISGVVVISEEDEQQIQRHIGGKLTNESTRKIVFDNTSAMLIVVIDQEWERVSIYVRGKNGFSQNSFSSFKNSTDTHNDTISEMMKSMTMGSAPSF